MLLTYFRGVWLDLSKIDGVFLDAEHVQDIPVLYIFMNNKKIRLTLSNSGGDLMDPESNEEAARWAKELAELVNLHRS